MNVQSIIAILIVLGAVAYVGNLIYKKTRAFSPTNRCASDCGCASKTDKKQPAI